MSLLLPLLAAHLMGNGSNDWKPLPDRPIWNIHCEQHLKERLPQVGDDTPTDEKRALDQMVRTHCTCEYEQHRGNRWRGGFTPEDKDGPPGFLTWDTFRSAKKQCSKELTQDPIKMIDRYLPLYPLEADHQGQED